MKRFTDPSESDITFLRDICKELSVLAVFKERADAPSYIEIISSFFKYTEKCNSAQEALNLHKPGRFDLVYIDLDLSDMRASELIKNIKNYDAKQKFILFASAQEAHLFYDIIKTGVSAFVAKPVSIENFSNITRCIAQEIVNDAYIEKYTQSLRDQIGEINEESELHRQLSIQQQKLSQTGEMISMIAHQWRQPLSAITAIIGGLRTRLGLELYLSAADPFKKLEEDLDSAFMKIEESAGYLSKTINDFRNFYRPDRLESRFNVAEVIERVCRMVLADKELHEIDLALNLDRTIVITSYESELMQVLINLLNNSRDAMREKAIAHPKLSISLRQGGAYIYIDVLDNGKGIDEKIIEKIFLPYFSTKSEKNGTGIGLHMSKNIVENHLKGSIKATNSQLFSGANFQITLPKNTTGESL